MSFYKKNNQYYVVDCHNWPKFSKELIALGFRWSGRSKLDTDLGLNHGISSKYVSGQSPFVINIYDHENKLICYSDLSAFESDVILNAIYCTDTVVQRQIKSNYKKKEVL